MLSSPIVGLGFIVISLVRMGALRNIGVGVAGPQGQCGTVLTVGKRLFANVTAKKRVTRDQASRAARVCFPSERDAQSEASTVKTPKARRSSSVTGQLERESGCEVTEKTLAHHISHTV